MSKKRNPINVTEAENVTKAKDVGKTREETNRNTKENIEKVPVTEEKENAGGNSAIQQHEDTALKTAMAFFADELLPYFGIEGKVAGFAPTEVLRLEVNRFFQDFNLIMEDGSWKHFEFQSKNEGTEGLRRYRSYEALTSYQNNVPVTTYVLFSGRIRNPMTELREGENTYRIVPIIMRDRNADQLIADIQHKIEEGELLTRKDLVPLALCLLMGGTMSLKDRVRAAFDITGKAEGIKTEDIAKIEAMVFIMADKFLERIEMEEIREGLRMTRLGEMLVELGKEEGLTAGRGEGIDRVNCLNNWLIREKRYADLERATKDKAFQRQLFEEYSIS